MYPFNKKQWVIHNLYTQWQCVPLEECIYPNTRQDFQQTNLGSSYITNGPNLGISTNVYVTISKRHYISRASNVTVQDQGGPLLFNLHVL